MDVSALAEQFIRALDELKASYEAYLATKHSMNDYSQQRFTSENGTELAKNNGLAARRLIVAKAEFAALAARISQGIGKVGHDGGPGLLEYVDRIETPDGLDDLVKALPNIKKQTRAFLAKAKVPTRTNPTGAESLAMMSSSDLADKYGVDAERLRKALELWRLKHDEGFTETKNRAANKPRFLYSEAAVIPLINGLKKKTKSSDRLPTGKK